ncbi:hypothetical protein [Streptomyces thermolilacinus]|uniref:Uncharacterized protein n=1 Tax=Streptomyces thermolilacinus SPC6 TaxID=1306406 RepID=A0A1D3DLC3_9ACTN|nr:hypothetical protein [Streptomyces thermolilacinus]OEJ93119.1 hypothetical protein J116_027965 [Streptomyces thermolilacinus SPC6]
MTQMTPAQLRADAEEALTPLGRRRIRLLAQLEEIDAELRPLIQRARAVEVPIRRIAELTAVSPNTVRAWTKDAE